MSKDTNSRNPSLSERIKSQSSEDNSGYMLFCVAEAIVLLALLAVFCIFFRKDGNEGIVAAVSVAVMIFYILSAGSICAINFARSYKAKKTRRENMHLETEIYDIFRYTIDLPYALIDMDGKVKIMNGALQNILGYRKAVSGIDLAEFCSVPAKVLIQGAKNRNDYIENTIYDFPGGLDSSENSVTRLSDGRRYEVVSYIFKIRGENYYFLIFKDTEEILSLLEREEKESTVVAYIVLDNLQELTQYVRADYRAASAEVENIIKAWVTEMNGFIREYENDKYVAVFSKSELDKQMDKDFEISHKIMDLKIGDNSFPITISMGISPVGSTLSEKERSAFDALSIAIRRGGNQIAICRENSSDYLFFGGTHKTIENNTSIVSRVSGDILESKIKESSGVLIMGHSSPDFDSIGSAVGIARFAMSVISNSFAELPEDKRPQVNIIVDKNNDTFNICREQLAPMKIYEDIFIGKEAAKDLVDSETVLIICDVNNPYIYEAPELVGTVRNIALLDHHRLAHALTYTPFLQYVEATKSSASEIVSEILLRSKYSDTLHKEEAEVLLSGIMLDTNNFTRNAGQQTFEITHYLYSRGAHTGVVREFFNESLEELLLADEFESNARLYRDCIAITWMSAETSDIASHRIIASKVADKLLRIRGVEASFALVKIDDDVVISGRSKGGINVQLILERLKGGGHFDIAGAQVKGASLTASCEMLKDAIDDYFEYDHKKSAED